MKHTYESAYSIRIHVAGDLDTARALIRKHCTEFPRCVTVASQEFIYEGGSEAGLVVGIENYPRFPASPTDIQERTLVLAQQLIRELCQRTALVVTPVASIWVTEGGEA